MQPATKRLRVRDTEHSVFKFIRVEPAQSLDDILQVAASKLRANAAYVPTGHEKLFVHAGDQALTVDSADDLESNDLLVVSFSGAPWAPPPIGQPPAVAGPRGGVSGCSGMSLKALTAENTTSRNMDTM